MIRLLVGYLVGFFTGALLALKWKRTKINEKN